jgi:hypothetical protein
VDFGLWVFLSGSSHSRVVGILCFWSSNIYQACVIADPMLLKSYVGDKHGRLKARKRRDGYRRVVSGLQPEHLNLCTLLSEKTGSFLFDS